MAPVDALRADGGPVDGGVDTEPPQVTSSRPGQAAEDVSIASGVEIRFSERIDPASGSLVAEADGAAIGLETPTWVPEGDVLALAPSSAWPTDAQVSVTVSGFRDVAGNEMTEPFVLVFRTSDTGRPTVVDATPAEGAVDVDATLDTITIHFSEPMNPHLGTTTLSGGEGALGDCTWVDATVLEVDVAGLRPGTAYRVVLDGFVDVGGNPLDGTPSLSDSAIDFETAADTNAPVLVDSNPTSGQLDIDVLALGTITLRFSEPMDTSIRTAVLHDGTAAQTLTGNWFDDGTRLTFSVVGRLAVDATHRLDLGPMRDRAGNSLDGTVLLDGGDLVFTTTVADESIPFVVFSSPSEGGVAATRATTIEVTFSEAMDTAVTAFDLVRPAGTVPLTGTWNAAGTRLTLPVAGALTARTAFRIDLGATRDLTGNALDASHPYLGDGILAFTTGVPTGEDCIDPLTTADATRAGAAYRWELGAGAFQVADGRPSCSAATNVHSGVIEYVKTTADVAGGGTALRIVARTLGDVQGVQLEVSRDVCDPGAGTTARAVCVGDATGWVQYLDVPAGSYFVWVGSDATAFAGATVSIEEVAAVPIGEGCDAPYDTTAPFYSSPGTDEHVWRVPFASGTSVEHGTSIDGESAISCATRQGPDSVIRVPKARSSSILDVTVEPYPAESSIIDRSSVFVEARSTCAAPTGRVLACSGGSSTRRFQLDVPAGDAWLWLAANYSTSPVFSTGELQRVDVRVREVDPGPGETCLTAIPVSPGASNPVAPASTARYFPPSCIASPANVTWYRFTTTRELSLVGTVGASPMAVVDRSTGADLGCWADASQIPMPVRVAAGTELCVALASGTPVTALAVSEHDWQGVVGTATDLRIARPVDGAGVPYSITSESFLEVTPTQLYLGINTDSANTTTTAPALVAAPRAGGDVATRLPIARYSLGKAAVSFGEALFSVDETNATARPARLHRLISAAGVIDPMGTVWDTGSAYGAVNVFAMARLADTDRMLIANVGSTTVPTSFFTASSTTPEAVVRIGENALLRETVALAASADFVFLIASTAATGRTVYRLPRADLTATPTPLAPAAAFTLSSSNGSMAYDPVHDILYFRSTGGTVAIHAIWGAASATPIYAGRVVQIGRSGDHGLAIDPAVPALFVFESVTESTGAFAEVR